MEILERAVGILSLCLLAVVFLGFSGLVVASIPDMMRYLKIRRM